MSDLEFMITASDSFGTFVWEYPPDVKELLERFTERFGEEQLREIKKLQQKTVEQLLFMLTGTLMAGDKAQLLAENIQRHLGELCQENLRIIRQ